MASAKLNNHLAKERYGDFVLTDAIRPSLQVPIIPEEGFRIDVYRDSQAGLELPVLVAALSREKLFDVFVDLLQPLGESVDLVLETSHQTGDSAHKDLVRDHIDLPVLLSHFYDHEDLLLNDGCTGTAVVSSSEAAEVQFDEHKLLVVYAQDLEPFEQILRQHKIPRNDALRLITEGEHLHSSKSHYLDEFECLALKLGVSEPVEGVRW